MKGHGYLRDFQGFLTCKMLEKKYKNLKKTKKNIFEKTVASLYEFNFLKTQLDI